MSTASQTRRQGLGERFALAVGPLLVGDATKIMLALPLTREYPDDEPRAMVSPGLSCFQDLRSGIAGRA